MNQSAVQHEPSKGVSARAREVVRRLTAFDYETHLIGPGAVFPKPVCWTAAWREDPADRSKDPNTVLVANGDGEDAFWGQVEALYRRCLETGDEIVYHNGPGFDMPVAALWRPSLMSIMFKVLEAGLVRDTLLREKLINLATHGFVDKFYTPDGVARDINYSLEKLVLNYLGYDRRAGKGEEAKKGGRVKVVDGQVAEWEGEGKKKQGIWRFNFDALDGKKASEYPKDAADYAVLDTFDTLLVKEAQDARAREKFTDRGATFPDGTPFDVFRTEPLHNGAKFALSLMTWWGHGVKESAVREMEVQVKKALAPERTKLLFERVCDVSACQKHGSDCDEHGKIPLLSRALPERQQTRRNKAGQIVPVISKKTGQPKVLNAKKEKLSKKRLLEIVQATWLKNAFCDEKGCQRLGKQCDEHGLPVLKKTEPSKKFPDGQISTDGEVISDLAPHDPILAQYDNRSQVQKLTTLYIPMLNAALKHGGVIHGGYDDLKRTGRISGRGTKSYPSFNSTQVPRGFVIEYPQWNEDKTPLIDPKTGKQLVKKDKIEPRHCLEPRNPGWVYASVDFGTIELVTLAQQLYKVFGYSKMRDKINAGFDFHAFMGSQLAWLLDKDFTELATAMGVRDEDAVYELFLSLKVGSKDEQDFYKLYRNFGKPTNLGIPGGLGAKTLLGYAKNTFGVLIPSIEKAKQFKEVLLRVCPEIAEYLGNRGYIMREMVDEVHSKPDDTRFSYFTPSGMFRANCSYTAAANGYALQSPAAEGGKIACFNLARAAWDPEMGSCLYGCRPAAFVHDEFIVEIPKDKWMHERCMEISRIMCDSMKVITPDMVVKAEPALMEGGWDKGAELVLGSDDRIRIWSPKEKYTKDAQGRLRSAV